MNKQKNNADPIYIYNSVRTRVNTWVSSFVKEMKIKRPAVQKLVDSVPANTSCVNISDLKAEPIQSPALVILEADSVNSNELETTTSGKIIYLITFSKCE